MTDQVNRLKSKLIADVRTAPLLILFNAGDHPFSFQGNSPTHDDRFTNIEDIRILYETSGIEFVISLTRRNQFSTQPLGFFLSVPSEGHEPYFWEQLSPEDVPSELHTDGWDLRSPTLIASPILAILASKPDLVERIYHSTTQFLALYQKAALCSETKSVNKGSETKRL